MEKIRFTYSKSKLALYLTNDELVLLFKKALQKSNIEVDFSKNFIEFASSLELGIESTGEIAEVILKEAVDNAYFVKALNEHLPEGITILSAEKIEPLNLVKLNKRVLSSSYQIQINYTKELLENKTITEINALEKDYESKMNQYLSNDEVLIVKKSKNRMEKIDIKSKILDYNYDFNTLNITFLNDNECNISPELFMDGFSQYLDNKVYFNAKRTKIDIG